MRFKDRYITIFHIAFWAIYILLPLVPLIFPDKEYKPVTYLYIGSDILLNVINYYIVYFLVKPDIFSKRKIFTTIVYFILFNLSYSAFRIGFTVGIFLLWNNFFGGIDLSKLNFTVGNTIGELLNSIGFTIVAVAFKYTFDWFKTQQNRNELIQQSQASEIALLRQQINPHFLFNTLNNLYSLSYKNSEDTPKAILLLSEIMRYMLYEAVNDKAPLEKEIDYMRNYLNLCLLRIKDKNYIDVKVEGDLKKAQIAPMILNPFIENAFKHGSKQESAPGIIIRLIARKQKLIFNVMNYKSSGANNNENIGNGIGIKNVRRRLELIYPDKHKLNIEETDKIYRVELEIEDSF